MDGNDNTENPKPLYKMKKVIIPALILIAALVAFWFWYQGQLGHISTDDANIDGDRANISSKILGKIDKLFVDEGDTVKFGQLVAVLDSTNLFAQENEAEAQFNLAKQNIKLAQIKLDKAKDDFNRAELQFKNKLIPKETYDHALKQMQEMQAQVVISQSQVSANMAKINVLSAELANTKITSSLNGVVAKKWVLKGDVVQPGQPIFSVYDNKDIWVTANYEETKLSNINLGDSVDISVDAYPDNNFKGIVLRIGANTSAEFALIPPNNASGNFTKVTQRVPIKISITQVNNGSKIVRLLPGMSVEVDIIERK